MPYQRGKIGDIYPRTEVSFASVRLQQLKVVAQRIRNFVDFVQARTGDVQNKEKNSFLNALVKARLRCEDVSLRGGQEIGIIDYENYLQEVLSLLIDVLSNDDLRIIEGLFSGDQIISEY